MLHGVRYKDLVSVIIVFHELLTVFCTTLQFRGRFTRHVIQNETFFPHKVDAKGSFLTFETPHFYNLFHHGRSRRSLTTEADPLVRYAIHVDGRQLIVELWPNRGLFSPGLVVERRRRSFRDTKIQRPRQDQCHYVGHVEGDRSSRVALSACQEGLIGHINIGKDHLYVEPVEDHWPDASGRHAHIVYRNYATRAGRERREVNQRDSFCGVIDNWRQAWENRLIMEMEKKNDRVNFKSGWKNDKSLPYYIETLVTADKPFVDYHRDHDVLSYILTLMNVVSDHFHDSSLGRNVNIVVVRVILLDEEDEEMGMAKIDDFKKKLSYFASWAENVNPPEPLNANHHDLAALLTRHKLCAYKDVDCDRILGLSSIASICNPGKAVSINVDTGLQTALTITHGIGHTLGCAHDDKGKEGDRGCPAESPDGLTFIMAQDSQPFSVQWSPCSKTCISTLLDSGMGDCLLNEPIGHAFRGVDMPSGAMYGAEYQCRDLTGSSRVCHKRLSDICEELWCETPNGTCVSGGWPAADGTSCGVGRWCWSGSCVEAGRRTSVAMDGEWSAWGPWSSCSRTCGGGVEASERSCDRPPPAHGGRFCPGERRRVRVCNVERCDLNKPSFREVQCAAFDQKPFQGRLYKWKPYFADSQNNCELLCYNDVPFFASLAPVVKDGTPCRENARDMCIGGLCMPVGCDWVLGSDAVEDACGICNGDGSRCHFVQMLFDEERIGNYVKITEIPANSYRVRVEETRPSTNFIAVASKEGEFFLNGDFKQTHNGEYKFGVGVIGVYTHPESERELLVIEGPTTQALQIYEVFLEKANPGVRISYYERINKNTKYNPVYNWEFLEWKPCDRRCGGGSQVSLPNCVEKTAGIVSATFCNASIKPSTKTRPCNVQPCAKRWDVSSWSMCSGNDTYPGEQHRKVECVKENPILEEDVVAVDESLCVGEKPVESRECRFLEASANVSRYDTDEANVLESNVGNEDESFGAHSYDPICSTGTYATTGKRKLYFNKHRTRSFTSSSTMKRFTTHRTTTSYRRFTTTKKCKKSTSKPTCKKTSTRATGFSLPTAKYGRVFANPPLTTNMTELPPPSTECTTLSVLPDHQTSSMSYSTLTNTETTKSKAFTHRGISKRSTFLPLIGERNTYEMVELSSVSTLNGNQKGLSHPTKTAFHTTKTAFHTTKTAFHTTKTAYHTTRMASRATKMASRASKKASRATKMASRATKMASRATKMASRATKIASRTTKMTSRATKMAPRTTKMAPRTAKMTSRASKMASRTIKMTSRATKMASRATKMAFPKSKNDDYLASIATTQKNSFLPLSHRFQQTVGPSAYQILTSEMSLQNLENHRNHRKEASERKRRSTQSRVSNWLNLHKSTPPLVGITMKPGIKAIATYFPNKKKFVTFHEVVKNDEVSAIKNVSLVNGFEWKRLPSDTMSYSVGSESWVNLHSSTSLYNIFKSKKNRQNKPSILNVIDRVQENESILRLIPSISRHGIVPQNGVEKNTRTNTESTVLLRSSVEEDENNMKSHHRKKKRGKN